MADRGRLAPISAVGTVDAVATAAAAIVAAAIEDVFRTVGVVRDALLVCDAQAHQRGSRLGEADVAALRDPIRGLLRDPGCVPVGLGTIIAPELLHDADLYLEWWQSDGEPALGPVADPTEIRLEVDLNPASMSFYDYEVAPWFAVPRKTLRRHVVGPYVDVHGTERYVLTLTEPVLGVGGFLGVAGADVPAARLENLVLRELGGLDEQLGAANSPAHVIVTAADGRIVVSTSPRWLVGSLPQPGAIPDGAAAIDLDDLPWRVTVVGGSKGN